LVGKEYGWKIDDDSNVTRISALMVNEEKIGVYQDAGEKNWWKIELPKNVTVYKSIEELARSDSKAYLIISDRIIDDNVVKKSVIYRPQTLVVGIGLHGDTTKEKIKECLGESLSKHGLSLQSIARLVSIKKPKDVQGLIDAAKDLRIPLEYFDRDELAKITIPNPSEMVQAYEGTPSVSEAAAIKSSGGRLVVEKQRFPPDLTIAIARIER
jgi:cobalt-precorrin 5A hydrolase